MSIKITKLLVNILQRHLFIRQQLGSAVDSIDQLFLSAEIDTTAASDQGQLQQNHPATMM